MLTTGLRAEGWYSPHSSVCIRMKLPRRGVKVKKVWKVGKGLIRDDFKAQQREFVLDSLLTRKPVKRVKQRADVSGSGAGSEDKSGGIVLYLLMF